MKRAFYTCDKQKKKCLLGFQLMLLGLNMEKIGQTPLRLLQKREPGPPGPPALLRDEFPLAHVCLLSQGDPCPAWEEIAVGGSAVKWAVPCALALTCSSGGVSGAPPGAQPWVGGLGNATPLPGTSAEVRALRREGSVRPSAPQVRSSCPHAIITFRIIKLIADYGLRGLGA